MKKKIKIHVKNNHWAPGSFPTDAEGEKNFTITKSHFDKALEKFPGQTHRSLHEFLTGVYTQHIPSILPDDTINVALKKRSQSVQNEKNEFTPKQKEYREKIVSCYCDMFKQNAESSR